MKTKIKYSGLDVHSVYPPPAASRATRPIPRLCPALSRATLVQDPLEDGADPHLLRRGAPYSQPNPPRLPCPLTHARFLMKNHFSTERTSSSRPNAATALESIRLSRPALRGASLAPTSDIFHRLGTPPGRKSPTPESSGADWQSTRPSRGKGLLGPTPGIRWSRATDTDSTARPNQSSLRRTG